MVWMGITFRASSLLEWLSWFAQDGRSKNAIFQCKLLALCALIYYSWWACNVKLYTNVSWSFIECAMLIIMECKTRIDIKCKVTNTVTKRWRDRVIL